MRPATIAMLALAFGAIAVLFHVSYLVSELADALAQVNRDIERDRDEVHVLRAEWSFLNRAERLQALSARYLALAPFDPAQIVTAAALPTKQPTAPDGVVVAVAQPTAPPLAGRPKPKPPTPVRAMVQRPVVPAPTDRTLDDVLATLASTGALR